MSKPKRKGRRDGRHTGGGSPNRNSSPGSPRGEMPVAAPPQSPHQSSTPEFVTGIVVGVLGAILFTVLSDYVPFYRTDLKMIPGATDVKIENPRTFNGAIDLLWVVQMRVVNYGLRPGYISHIEVVPLGVNPTPKVEISDFDQNEFWPWVPRVITIRAVEYTSPSIEAVPNCFKMNAYDDTGRMAFWAIWGPNLPGLHGKPSEECKNF